MSNSNKNPPAPQPRARERIEDTRRESEKASTLRSENQGGDQSKELPGGKDPREPQYPGPMSTSENVTTEEQKAAQAAMKEDITDAGTPYGSQATRAEQIESQVAAAENPLSPQSTSINEPHETAAGLVHPPRPEGQRNVVPQPRQMQFDPQTGAPTTAGKRRMRLEQGDDGEDEEVEVTVLRPVTLTDDHGAQHQYQPGEKVKMPRSHAEHWYMKLHTKQEAKKERKKAE